VNVLKSFFIVNSLLSAVLSGKPPMRPSLREGLIGGHGKPMAGWDPSGGNPQGPRSENHENEQENEAEAEAE
jgi:hypothetical protein